MFLFIDGTLERLLNGKWAGPNKYLTENIELPHHWLWSQIAGAAAGLRTIHNPHENHARHDGKRIVGFHFDLKSANILVTDEGDLKIF